LKKIIIITGVAGFIGSRVATRFIEEGYEVIGIDDLSNGKIKNIPKGIDFIRGDLSRKKTISLLPRKCNQLLHLAGQSSGEISFDNPVVDLNKNTVSTLNLINYAIEKKVERIIYSSSMSVYGNKKRRVNENDKCEPLSCYAVGKIMAEKYLHIYKKQLPYISFRMSNVYGPGQDMKNLRQGMVSIYLAQALKNKKILIKGSLKRKRDFIYIDDIVECWFKASVVNSCLNEIINVGTGVSTEVKKLITIILKKIPGTKYRLLKPTKGDQDFIYPDNSKLKSKLGIKKFIPLEEGLDLFISSL
tara:strand:+ start:11156 stop:12061 length:906 start_codon:yes stop_codon:yes gene_type:complete